MFDIIETENEKIYLIKEYDVFKNVSQFEEHIETFIKNDHRNLVIDMKELAAIDSLFLSVVLKFRTKLSLGGRSLRITNYNEYIRKSFQLLNLEDHLLE